MQKRIPTSRRKTCSSRSSHAVDIPEGHPALHDAHGPARTAPAGTGPLRGRPPLIRDIPGIVLQIDPDGKLAFMNDFGRALFGCGAACIGTDITRILVDPLSSPSSSNGPGIPLPSLGAYFNGERRHRFSGGGEAWISWSSKVIPDEAGGEKGLLCTGIDITDLRRFKDKASACIDSLAFLSHAGMFFVEHTTREDLYRFIGQQLHRLLGDSLIIVASYDGAARSFTVRGLWAGKKESAFLQQLLGRPLTGLAFPLPPEMRHPVPGRPFARVRNVHELSLQALPRPLCARIERMLGTGNIYALPIAFQSEQLGAAALLTRSREKPPNQKLIEAFIAQASAALKRVNTEEEVVHAAEEWRTTFDSISDILFVTDRDARILRVNRACADLLGRKPGDVIGKYCADVFSPAFCSSHPPLRRQVLEHGTKMLHEFFDPRLRRHYELSLAPVLGKNGEAVKVIHVIKDITERKRSEELSLRANTALQRIVREKTEELQGTQRELENARRLSDIGVLAATIAHEIRNPLAAIKTAAYNIRRKSRNPDLESHLANIDKKVMESDQIIRNLLSYSRIKLPNYEWVPVAGVLNECLDALAEKYARGEIEISRDLAAVADTLIEADPVHLKVLFNNILDNACQALAAGKGSVRLAARCDAKELTVSVRDTGIGIAPEDLKRLSEPFFTTKSRGIGLGLTICYQVANLHHGRIQITSEKEKGTTVSVTLPLSHASS